MLTVGVLGAVEARREGVPLPVPAGKTTDLLARLALEAGAPVRADVLLDELWDEPVGRNTLQSKVSQLRRGLGDRDAVVGTTDGYRLVLDADGDRDGDGDGDGVDAYRAARLAEAAAEARAQGDPSTALTCATEALGLYRGEVLVEAGDWATPYRARFEEVRLGLVEAALAARVDLGAGAELVAELELLVDEHPLREGLWASLVTALYRGGRQADALAAYSRVRRLLVAELGVEPGPALRALERDVLSQRDSLGPSAPAVSAPGNLPPPPTGTVGRGTELAAVVAAVATYRVVTVLGPAGVGKTRLGLEAAHLLDAPGGVWLVRLDAVEAPAEVERLVAETLRVPGGPAALRDRLAGSRTVLVLDNCEHVVGDVAVFVTGVLDAVPGLRVLATSQAPLGVAEEHTVAVTPLSHEDAVVLFTRRATAARPLTVDDEAVALVHELCRSLDGLPLALELAAARVRSLSLADLARRLDDRFALLRDPASTGPDRRRTLAGAIAWSYDLLFPDDQRALWALSCFAGGASLDAAQHVMSALDVPEPSVVDTIARLVDRSLARVEEGEGGAVRYRLLDSIKAFAGDRLDESGDRRAAEEAHASWYAALATWCDDHVRTDRQAACLQVVRAERADVDAALAWCAAHDPGLGRSVAHGFAWSWVVLADGVAGAARLRASVAPTGPEDTEDTEDTDHTEDTVTARILLCAAWLEASAGDLGVAQADLDRAGSIVDAVDDDVLVADLRRHQAFVCIQQGKPHGVLENAGASLETYRALRQDWPAAASLLLAAFGSLMLGDTGAARRDAVEAVHLLAPLGDAWGTVHAQAMLGSIAQAEQRADDAVQALAAAADASAVLGFPGQAALHRASLARVQHRAGDPAADASYRRAIDEALAGGDGRLLSQARLHYAGMLRARGDLEAARSLVEENERWYAGAGGGDFALLNKAVLAALHDDAPVLGEVARVAEEDGDDEAALFALDGLARLTAERGDLVGAEDLLAEADSLTRSVGHRVDEQDRVDASGARALLAASGAGS